MREEKMIMVNMTYDIRTTEYAQQTLMNLTGVPISKWEKYLNSRYLAILKY